MKVFTFVFSAMGSSCSLQFYASGKAEAENVAEVAIGEVDRIQKKYSRYLPQSFLSKINAAARKQEKIIVDGETAGLLTYALACYRQSDGLFDITSGVLRKAWRFRSNSIPRPKTIEALLARVGMAKLHWEAPTLRFAVPGIELDFGGLAKEYAVDRMVDLCRHHGICHGFVELGGDVGIIGPHPDGTPWQVGIRHPRAPGMDIATVPLKGGALAVSGDYERFIERKGRRLSHILNPRTGWPCEGLSSVAVIADRCMAAGSISTIAMLKGKDGPAWLGDLNVPCLHTDDSAQPGRNGAWEILNESR